MHFFSRRNASLALGLAAVGVLAACGDDVTVPVAPPAPVVISITPQAVTLNPGASATLSVQISGGDPTPTLASCASGATGVATATVSGNGCTVTAVGSGSTTITATTSAGQSASAAVTVNQLPSALGELTVSPSTAALTGGQTLQLVPNPNAAGSGVTVAYTYASSDNAIATVNASGVVTAAAQGVATITVTATGTGAGFSAATRTFGVTINVVSAAPGITSLSATPSSLALATDGKGQVAASVQQPSGAPAATITFGTTNPAVATVTVDPTNANLATVTGVSAGTATITVTASAPAATGFAASTLTQLIPVTVSPSAQVAIGNITSALSNNPVDITDVRNQIQVALNITTNGQNVQSAQVWVCEPSDDVPTCAARTNGVPAAQQSFGSAGANDGIINTFINTAEFTVAADFSDATVRHTNGQKVLVATLTVPNQAAVASNNRAILNFNNTDGFASSHTAPSRSAVNATTNTTLFGGPDAAGRGSITVVPVLYTQGKSIARVTVGVTGACSRTLTFVSGTNARPWTYTYGYTVGTATPGTAANNLANAQADTAAFNLNCVGTESDPSVDPDLAPRVVSSIDNAQNSGPTAGSAMAFRTSTSNTPAVGAPATIRVDYAGPATTDIDLRRSLPAVTGWVNESFSFASNTAASTDNGVGVKPSSRSWSVTGCGSTTFTAIASGTGAALDECASDATGGWVSSPADTASNPDVYASQTRGPYRVRYTELDLLDNASNSRPSKRFGVDKTAPIVRWSAASAEDTTVLAATSAAIQFQAEFIDERGGFIDSNDEGAVTKSISGSTVTVGAISTANGSQYHFASRALGDIILTSGTTKAVCINPNSFTALSNLGVTSNAANIAAATGSAFQTNPNCSFRAVPYTSLSADLGDGYRAGRGVTLAQQEGIYHYATRVYDRAGNSSEIVRRRLAVDATVGQIANLALPAQVSATANPVLTYNAQDNVEVRATTIANSFTGFTGGFPLVYPQVLVDARFNDNINSPIGQAQTSLNTPTPVLIGLGNDVNATVTTGFERIDRTWLTGWDVANRGTNTLSGGYLSQGLPALQTLVGAGNYTSWTVRESRDAGFNAPEGLKAQLVANTNVSNSPFARVEFYRLDGAVGADAALATTWQYLGSVTQGIPADQGATRYWTYVLPDAQYASLPTSFEEQQAAAANGDVIVAIGVRTGGTGFITAGTTIGGPIDPPETITVTVNGLPTGVAADISIADGLGFTASVSASSVVTVPAAGTYFITASSVTVGSTTYPLVSVSANSVVVANDGNANVTVTYGAPPQVRINISGLRAGDVPAAHSLVGVAPLVFSASPVSGNTASTIVLNVPEGDYTLTPTSPFAPSGTTLRFTAPAATLTAAPNAPATFNVAYTQQNQRVAVRVTGPALIPAFAPNVTVDCTTNQATVTSLGDAFPVVGATDAAAAGACTVTAPEVLRNGIWYAATITNVTPTPSTGVFTTFTGAPTAAQVTVAYTALTPAIVIEDAGIAPGNLPNGLTYTVRVTSSEFAAEGGFRDFTKTTGTNLVIAAVPGSIYNVSVARTLVSTTQTWTTQDADVSATGGDGANLVTQTATNVVVDNVRSAATPAAAAEVRATITIEWTGPTPTP